MNRKGLSGVQESETDMDRVAPLGETRKSNLQLWRESSWWGWETAAANQNPRLGGVQPLWRTSENGDAQSLSAVMPTIFSWVRTQAWLVGPLRKRFTGAA
jgi:hypothetical protein